MGVDAANSRGHVAFNLSDIIHHPYEVDLCLSPQRPVISEEYKSRKLLKHPAQQFHWH